MKTFSIFRFRSSKAPLWLVAFFLLMMVTGCSKKDSAVSSLKEQHVAVSADSLCFYASMGDLGKIKLLLDAGIEVNTKNSKGSTALIEAAWTGKKEVVSYLLDVKADVNLASSEQMTALGAAVDKKQEPVALLLLEKGANPNVVDASGSSPLMNASWLGTSSVVKALLKKGALPNYIRPKDGSTAIKIAVAANHQDIVQLLKASGATE